MPGKLFLQKELYAICLAQPQLQDEIGFDSHLLGPFSDILANEAEQLSLSGLIDFSSGQYHLTSRGISVADSVANKAPPALIQEIGDVKKLMNDLSPDELLALVYLSPRAGDFEGESSEFKRIASNRIPLALRLFRKGKISTSRAAEIAGIAVDEFISEFDRLPA